MAVIKKQTSIHTSILKKIDIFKGCSSINSEDFKQLERTVKYAIFPDSPTILHLYLDSLDTFAKKQPISNRTVIYTELLDALLEVYSDSLLPRHWRGLCLNYCYRPLAEIKQLAKTTEEENCF